MKIIVNGPSGIDKKEYLGRVVKMAQKNGITTELFNVGDMMYGERPDIPAGKILELPLPELRELRRVVFGKILDQLNENAVVTTHACFRWRHCLFPSFEREFLDKFSPDKFITIIDDVDAMKIRVDADPYWRAKYTLKDLMNWRDEEVFTSELMADIWSKPHYVVARNHPVDTIFKLIFRPNMKKAYISFPITHIQDQPETIQDINKFRASLQKLLVVFDPFTIKERDLVYRMNKATADNKKAFVKEVLGRRAKFNVGAIKAIKDHIDEQIIARDFKMIEQGDMLVAYIPLYKGTRKPVASSGVDREISYAHSRGKDVFLASPVEPGPFIRQSLTKYFTSLDDLLNFIKEKFCT